MTSLGPKLDKESEKTSPFLTRKVKVGQKRDWKLVLKMVRKDPKMTQMGWNCSGMDLEGPYLCFEAKKVEIITFLSDFEAKIWHKKVKTREFSHLKWSKSFPKVI